MAFRHGEVYRCPDPSCAAELTVTKAAPPGCTGAAPPTCCCGKTMEPVSETEKLARARDAADLREFEDEREYGVITEAEFQTETRHLRQ